MIFKLEETKEAKKLFGDWQETMIWSCVDNIMGEIYTDDLDKLCSVVAIIGDFCFFAGEVSEELIKFALGEREFIIMVPQNINWGFCIENVFGEKAKKVRRFAFKKEKDNFDLEKLNRTVEKMSRLYHFKEIDENLFYECQKEEWSKSLVSSFKDFEEFKRLGLGYLVLDRREIICGASSYTRYGDGIEIEVDTKEEFRRKRFAYYCASKLIFECLKKGLYPSWNAQNRNSADLALKIGYNFDREYTAYEVFGK